MEKPDNFDIDDDFSEELLKTEISNAAKIEIIKIMDLQTLLGLPKRASIIGPIINNSAHLIPGIDGNIAECLIVNSRPLATQISLFNSLHHLMDATKVRNIMSKLPAPYSEIKTGYHTPRLKNTLENKNLVKWLHDKKLISSWSENDTISNDLKINLYRR